jgi:lipoprotein-releasing system permease protein
MPADRVRVARRQRNATVIRPLELYIGLRYTRARRRNHFISFISMTSMLGITIGVWALISVLSVMNGFERELRDRILSITSHVTVSGHDGWLSGWERLARFVVDRDDVLGHAPFILGQGMLTQGREVNGALIRGIDPAREPTVSEVSEHMVNGSFDDLVAGEYRMILGRDLAWQLGAEVGSRVTLIAPEGQVTPAGLLPRLRRFEVSGIFQIGMYEYDSALALIHIDDAARVYRAGEQVSGLRLRIDDVFQAPWVRFELARELGADFSVTDWTREHSNFFRALQIERRVMFLILFLIVAVAAFNIVSTLVMTVTDKQADIAILRTLGISPASVMAVFVVQGVVIGVIGTLLGGIAGVVTAINIETLVPAVERLLNIQFFPPDVYIISEFPAELRVPDVIRVLTVALIMSLVATLYPAWRAARTQPAEALRYE